ncbi:component of oligomeric golgi complex 6 [Coccomyxa subellipsoidea C-169]|uniref:Conserved oligomeric Golgi complex subunit 6 n=1 Tax=Coccomyxa subellipsoidea (strain C-169) TaxID=574566 RepID=I0ZAY0_COCSC|nr:component of oligomeric golgi complex 6 [Coccomyxa subellipsoidea C-169]EIE27799.1 component of oligomeric golgi complex 6 [Coccomyxa subellipsoidea C-169]|eukprot:XP_005652343.1 component of oligomeric golgi complex 6 [Coccomyxa subellipsoidea C-169]
MAPAPTTALAPGLARKVNKILATRTESPEILGALSTLSGFYEENTPVARRRLRTTIEQHGLGINEQFLAAAEAIIKALDAAQADLDALAGGCARINGALMSSRASAMEMLAETERVARELAASETRSKLVDAFLQQYQLTPDEVTALQGQQIGEPFFVALERVRGIHGNCRSLLRTAHQRAGLELMDLMSSYQETAYEHLCRWVQGECRRLGDADAPEVDSVLQRAAAALRERPVLFKYCAEEVAQARHNALFQRFIGALTRGGPGGMPRPIEMHAHDPRRFVSDMLAWALASERELLVSLFGADEGVPSTAADHAPDQARGSSGRLLDAVSPRAAAAGNEPPKTSALLDQVFESICRPLKVRIEGMLMAAPPLLLCFQISQLLAFYARTVAGLIGAHSRLADALTACCKLARRVFAEQLKARGDRMLRYPPAPPADLSPPPQVAESLGQLMEIVAAFEESYEADGGAGGAASSEAEFAPVLAAAIDPLVEMCERSAEALTPDAPTRVDERSTLSPSAKQVYLTNCLSAMAAALGRRACCAGRAAALARAAEGHMARLVGGEAGALLARCGLAEIADRVRLYTAGEKLAEGAVMAADPSLPLARISGALHALFAMLSNPDTLPEFRTLQSPRLRADATARVAAAVAAAYEAVHSAVADTGSGYAGQPGFDAALEHSPEHVRTILGVLG